MKNPAWLRDAVIYQVLIDRFHRGGASGNRRRFARDDEPVFCGGNLRGVKEKLGYITELGANTIWLSPFNKTANYHGYHVTDYLTVEPRFGGWKAFSKLMAAAKKAGLRVVMDFVPNHVHETHPWFQSARKSKTAPRRDWFVWKKNGDYLKFLEVGELPKLNLDHPACRKEIIGVAKFWAAQGIDGFRLDHVLGPSLDFWREFRREVKAANPDLALIGEVYFSDYRRSYLETIHLPKKAKYLAAQRAGKEVDDAVMGEYVEVMDGLLDFQFQKLLRDLLARPARPKSAAQIQKYLTRHYRHFPEHCSMISFLDNHDMNRFLFEAGGDKKRLLQALEIQFSQKSPAVIYNGTELAAVQKAAVEGPYGDLQVRRMVDWRNGDQAVVRRCRRLIASWKTAHGVTKPDSYAGRAGK